MGKINKYLELQKSATDTAREAWKYRKLLDKFLVLGQRWAFNDMNKQAQYDFLSLFGEVKETLAKYR